VENYNYYLEIKTKHLVTREITTGLCIQYKMYSKQRTVRSTIVTMTLNVELGWIWFGTHRSDLGTSSGCVRSDFRFTDERKNRTHNVAKRMLYYSAQFRSDEKTWRRTFLLHRWLCSRSKAPKTRLRFPLVLFLCKSKKRWVHRLSIHLVSSSGYISFEVYGKSLYHHSLFEGLPHLDLWPR